MELAVIVNYALPVIYVVVGIFLVWLIAELALTMRRTRKTVAEVQKQVEPVIANVERITTELEPAVQSVRAITAQLEPTVAKVDPLLDRVTLTVDAANLEIMRVDQILEDVTQITGSVSNTLDTVDAVTNAPLELVSSVTDKVRSVVKPRGASKESAGLGAGKHGAQAANPVRDFVDAAAEAAGAAAANYRNRKQADVDEDFGADVD